MVALCLTLLQRARRLQVQTCWLAFRMHYLPSTDERHACLANSDSKLVVDVSVGLAPFILQLLSGGIGSSHSIIWINYWY